MGRATERVKQLGHDRLKTFGVGTDLDKREWQSVFRQLVAQGHLDVDVEGHGGLHFSETAPAVLRGDIPVAFRGDAVEATPSRRAGDAKPGPAVFDGPTAPGDEALWEALRTLRLELAREQGVPPYIIFHDATLLDMVRRRPRDLAEMSRIPGVGHSKLERYGARFLATLGAAQG
jgi:ATP-dependent DNA helicase RecQ